MLQPVVNLLGDLQQEARPLLPLPPPPPPITLPPAPPTPAPNVTYAARTPGIYFDTEVYPRPTTVQHFFLITTSFTLQVYITLIKLYKLL